MLLLETSAQEVQTRAGKVEGGKEESLVFRPKYSNPWDLAAGGLELRWVGLPEGGKTGMTPPVFLAGLCRRNPINSRWP